MYIGDYVLPPPGPGQVRVNIMATAINPVDWKVRRGVMRIVTGNRFPRGMGTDFAGVVEAIGRGVMNVRVGDEVFGTTDLKSSGAFGPMAITESRYVVIKPANLSFSAAACLPVPATTAWAAIIDKGRVQAGSRVFIHGCSGAVGAFAAQIARAHGAEVCGACGPAAISSAKAAGIHPVFDYADRQSFAARAAFDIVFDTVGTLDVGAGLAMLKSTAVFIDINPTPRRLLRGMLSRRYKLVFSTMGYQHLPGIGTLAEQGTLCPTIAQEAPFSEAIPILTNVEAGKRPAGRVVLVL